MNKFLILFLFAINIGCNAQVNKNDSSKISAMEKFDKMKFDKNQIDGEYNFNLPDGTKVRQLKFNSEIYVVNISYPDSPRETQKEYYVSTLNLKRQGDYFYGFEIGVWKDYNESGEVVKETDFDKPYAFSVEDLIKKMKKTGVDLSVKEFGIKVSRNNNKTPIYIVSYPEIKGSSTVIVLMISGVDGEIVYKTQERIEE